MSLNDNDSLISVSGLSNLTSLGDGLWINDNDVLTHVDGLSNLTSVGDRLGITYNAVLADVSGLSNLTSVGGDLLIHDNPSLCQGVVDAFIAAFTLGGVVQNICCNDSGC